MSLAGLKDAASNVDTSAVTNSTAVQDAVTATETAVETAVSNMSIDETITYLNNQAAILEAATIAEIDALEAQGYTAKEAEAYIDANAVALETQYLMDAGFTQAQADAFIQAEENIVSNNSDAISNALSTRYFATPEQIAEAEVEADSAFALVK